MAIIVYCITTKLEYSLNGGKYTVFLLHFQLIYNKIQLLQNKKER